jgi:hypothetical protein
MYTSRIHWVERENWEYECRCNERLKSKAEVCARLACTGFRGGGTPNVFKREGMNVFDDFMRESGKKCHTRTMMTVSQ